MHRGACIVDRDVEAAKAPDGVIDELTDIFLMANVGSNKFSFRARLASDDSSFVNGVELSVDGGLSAI